MPREALSEPTSCRNDRCPHFPLGDDLGPRLRDFYGGELHGEEMVYS
jgi:hypothetical protein